MLWNVVFTNSLHVKANYSSPGSNPVTQTHHATNGSSGFKAKVSWDIATQLGQASVGTAGDEGSSSATRGCSPNSEGGDPDLRRWVAGSLSSSWVSKVRPGLMTTLLGPSASPHCVPETDASSQTQTNDPSAATSLKKDGVPSNH